jgi:hypothetical protein
MIRSQHDNDEGDDNDEGGGKIGACSWWKDGIYMSIGKGGLSREVAENKIYFFSY